jgi:hypothetical protein
MSFKVFIYYCALCGGWAAFLAWGIASAAGAGEGQSIGLGHQLLRVTLRGGLLGMFVAAAIGWLDARLNAVGFQRLVRTGLCAGLGLAAGTIGGIVGQLLFAIHPALLFVGWVLAGILIGAAVGAFDLIRALSAKEDVRAAFRKTFNGIIGGAVGGFVGGLPYTFLIGNQRLPNSSLTISLVILGMCIGLMIGLAQVVLKEAWLRVEEGFRAGRELMLSKDETTIGRAESCDLGLFGDNAIAKLHARIVLKDNRYLLAGASEDGETYINDEQVGDRPVPLRSGDRIRVGKSVLLFGERQKRKNN